MSRHRNIRGMNYKEEYDEYYDNHSYGHSVDDDYCISPSTEAQFMYKRNGERNTVINRKRNESIEEEKEDIDDGEDNIQLETGMKVNSLSEIDQAKLASCVEGMQDTVGDTIPETVLMNAAIKNEFDLQRSLNYVLDLTTNNNHYQTPTTQTSETDIIMKEEKVDDKSATKDIQTITDSVGRFAFGIKSESAQQVKMKEVKKEKSPKKVFPTKKDLDKMATESNASNAQANTSISGSSSATSTSTVHKQSNKLKTNETIIEGYKKDRLHKKSLIHLVVIGHVDAGKSTLMGHLLYKLDMVSKKSMHRYETDSKKIGKSSFLYAWVLDETEEERSRGITMDIAQSRFETEHRSVILLDAPGHKDFIPNMITGAAQADVALLVVDATSGEFEAGFEAGGQTQEHTLLARSLGVTQLAVVVNKLDNVNWSQERFKEICTKLSAFLKQAGFKEQDNIFVPCSGLTGENLVTRSQLPQLTSWYNGPSLLEVIDSLNPPERAVDKHLRLCVSDIFKSIGSGGLSIAGRIESGFVQNGQKAVIMPSGENCIIKSVNVDSEESSMVAYAGDSVSVTLLNCDPMKVTVGSILCEPSYPVPISIAFQARVVIFHNAEVPLTKGFPVVIHHKSLSEQAVINKLVSQLNKSTGEILKKSPRCLVRNTTGIIELLVNRPICIELYKDYKELGRFMLRSKGATIAAGVVTKIL